MIKLLLRVAMFVLGLCSLLDGGLPTVTESLEVDGHTSWTKRATTSNATDTSYTLQLAGGRVASCSIGYSAYSALKDGASVDVTTSRLLRSCLKITQNGEDIYGNRYWRWLTVIGGLFAMGCAIFGNFDRDEDD